MAATTGESGLLGIYLNDHLAGATGGAALARRLADAERNRPGGEVLARLAAEVEEDRAALLQVMAALDVPVRRYKVVAAWVAERVGRVKPNGHLVSRSPLSRVVELEGMRLGVEGKAACWRTLRVRADRDQRLDAARLDALLTRAATQIDELERLRGRAAAEAFGGEVEHGAAAGPA